MKKYKFKIVTVVLAGIVLSSSCKKELNIENPNSPTLAQASTETGLVSLAAGSVYVNGFMNGNYWLGNSFFSLEYGFDELLADDVASPDANQNVNVVNLPASVIFTYCKRKPYKPGGQPACKQYPRHPITKYVLL